MDAHWENFVGYDDSTGCLSIIRQSMFWFHQFSGMNFRTQFQISPVGTSLFLGGAFYVYVLMALYPELTVCSCQIIDSQPVFSWVSGDTGKGWISHQGL